MFFKTATQNHCVFLQVARSSDPYAKSRKIVVHRKHWLASKQGYYRTPYGVAFVHTDGSIAMFSQGGGVEVKCRCGAVHMT